MSKPGRSFLSGNSGSVAVIATLGLTALLGCVALALDVGHLLSMKNELQRAADAGAMAGARGLWPQALPIVANPPAQPDYATAESKALSVSTSVNNKVDGASLPSDKVLVQTGKWDYDAKTFIPCKSSITNAVQVVAQGDTAIYFAKVFGAGNITVSASATAVMDFAEGVGKGSLPIAISQSFVVPGGSLFVNFNPDQADNGAWFANPPDSASAKTFRDYIDNNNCPPLKVGDLINLQNGTDTSVLNDLQNKLVERGGTWDTVLPVVNTTKFIGNEPITGFVPFRITQVETTGNDKGVTGTMLGLFESPSAQPGGDNYGVLAPPKSITPRSVL